MASKFLTLAESVRDAADIYLSLKYPPPVFISDSPCGFARHMECRVPEVTNILWAENCGCFEKPSLGKSPNVSGLSRFIFIICVHSQSRTYCTSRLGSTYTIKWSEGNYFCVLMLINDIVSGEKCFFCGFQP